MGALRSLRPVVTVRRDGLDGRHTMADSLRPLRIRLVDPTLVGELIEFLRQRSCVAEQTDRVTIEVWPPQLLYEANGHGPANGASDALHCAGCGGIVEAALWRLGSSRCHDCRETTQHGLPCTSTNGNGRSRSKRARSELQEHLRSWRAGTNAAAALTD